MIKKRGGGGGKITPPGAGESPRPECHHCGDFSAELADISCGGVGAMDWTITVVRTAKGEALFQTMVEEGVLEVRSMDEFENSTTVLLRLAQRQRERVPVPPGYDASLVR